MITKHPAGILVSGPMLTRDQQKSLYERAEKNGVRADVYCGCAVRMGWEIDGIVIARGLGNYYAQFSGDNKILLDVRASMNERAA